MSGHSHYATIKRQKESNDAARGNLFSKLSKMIQIAIKSGGGPNPDANFKLKVAIEKARALNLPKDNVDRILKAAAEKMESFEEITYEGFGPCGVNVIVEVATDNKNRTAQEIKSIFDRAGGNMGSPNSVAFNFDQKGYLVIKKDADPQTQMLTLIDLGADDVNEVDDGLEVYVAPEALRDFRTKVLEKGFEIVKFELAMVPKSYVEVPEADVDKVTNFLDALDSHDDVQRVFSNF